MHRNILRRFQDVVAHGLYNLAHDQDIVVGCSLLEHVIGDGELGAEKSELLQKMVVHDEMVLEECGILLPLHLLLCSLALEVLLVLTLLSVVVVNTVEGTIIEHLLVPLRKNGVIGHARVAGRWTYAGVHALRAKD